MSMSKYDYTGYSGQSYDRNVFEANLSTVNKLQRDFWNAKQVLRKKFGKSEDQHIVASDAELDAFLQLFNSVQKTCADLIKATEKYQNCICVLSRDENAMGRFLKDQGSLDKTAAGKMMNAVGKAQCYTAQQRLNLRSPLGRLHHDIETFRYRAIGDSVLSVNQMEESRTHYRASLRWMQDISSNLDPEQYKKLEKFRKVQNEVRLNKEKFDRLKWAVCQKVDLLCASRSNLFSNTLVPYQNEIMKFWEKTAHTLAAVLENIKDYQHYEFKLLKGLNPMQDLEVGDEENEKKQTQEEEGEQKHGDNQLISLDELGGELANDLFERGIHDLDSERVTDKDEEKNADQDNGNLLLGEINETDFQEPTKEDLDL
uniref:AH domain-containing protein n=1 Tax=Ciona savignyi TaxID=51511 RepID=H2ZC38_CIOSA